MTCVAGTALAAGVAAAAGTSGAPSDSAAVAARRPLFGHGDVLVFEGDSMTRRAVAPMASNWPLLRMNQWNHSWADIVSEWLFAMLPELNLKTLNGAIGGSTVDQVTERYATNVAPRKPAWIFLTLGTNDARVQMPLAGFREKLAAYIGRAAEDAGTRCFFVGGFPPLPGLADDQLERLRRAQDYFSAAREVVAASGGLAPDLGPSLRAKAESHYAASVMHAYYADGVHYNALGNTVLAGLVLERLGAVFASSLTHIPTL